MIIATNVFDMKKVVSLSEDYDGLCNYIRSLMPERYKHIDAIYHNTRYYLNLEVLKASDISMEKKVSLSEKLTKNIRVVGYMDVYITCKDLERKINMKKVEQYYRGEKYGESN